MGLLGKFIDYGNPAGWVGLGANKLGITDGTLGDAVESGLDSLDRSNNQFKQVDPQGNLQRLGQSAEQFGLQGQQGFQQTGNQLQDLYGQLQARGQGQNLVSQQMLDQNMDRLRSQQNSMAAGAAPQNQAMAARTAMIQGGQQASGMAGQAALAGAQEAQAAQNALGGLLSRTRAQNLQAALQGRQQALSGFGSLEDLRAQRFQGMLEQPTKGERVLSMARDAASFAGMG